MKTGFGERLREAIDKNGITASELSRLSGVGRSDISNYLNGVYVAKQDKIYLLAEALHVDPGWLMTGVEPAFEKETEADEFVRVLMRLSPKNRRFIMRIMLDLLEGE